jgi:hypothetical protein
MKNTRRFFLRSFPDEPSGVTSIRLTYNSLDIAKWLDNNPLAIGRYRSEIRKRLKMLFPDAKIVLNGIPTADGHTWQIGSGADADQAENLFQCEEILEQVSASQADWMPKKT